MASTIQIKNSNTEGNSPSSLTQGELAINVNDGNLFYGDGSSVKQDFILGSVSASGGFTGSINASGIDGTIDISDQTNLAGGTNLTLSDDTMNLDANISLTTVTASSDITTAGSLITTKTGSVTDPALLIGVNSGYLAGNNTGIILEDLVPGTTFFVPYFVSNGAKIFGFGTVMSMEKSIDMQSNRIYFDGDSTNTYIASNADDPEDLEIHADQDVILNPDGQVVANSNISASGDITANSFIGDGSSLTNLPSQTDENFTTADHSKLDGIEASADVTDTTNVTAAGALMDSEVTNLAQVKAFDSSDYATAAQGSTADSAQQPPSEGAFVDGDKTKLDGIEASADVTDTTNVTAAGALMDSELTDLAAVKAINQGLTTTSDVTFDDITATTIDVTSNKLAKTSATDADHQGDVVFFGGTLSMDAGKIYHYNSSGNWELSNATDNTKSTGLLAVALGATSDGDGMLLKGMVTLDHDPGAVGDKLFLKATNGFAFNTAPSSTGNVTRVIGYCLDASNGQIYFNPSNDFIVHA